MNQPTVLETFNETFKANAVEVANLEKQMAARVKDAERTLERTRAELTRERGLFDKLKAEYASLEAGIEGRVRVGLDATEATRAKVEAGEITLDAFLKTGLNEKQLREKARAEAAEALAAGLKLIRAKRARIYELELAEADAVYSIAYATSAAPQLRAEKMKVEAEAFTRALNPIYEARYAAARDREKAEVNNRAAQPKGGVDNIQWENIGLEEIKALMFDPRIKDEWLPSLETFIAGASPDKSYHVLLRALANEVGTPAGLYFSEA